MVSNPKELFAQVFDFLELEFSESCLTLYQKESITRSSNRVNQANVKKAIDNRFVQRWRDEKYNERIDEFYSNPKAVKWLEKSGYDITRFD